MAKTNGTAGARFTSRYTDAQKHALLHSVIIDGRTIKATIDLAEAGELGIPAFRVGQYAYDIVKDGREQFEAGNEDALALAVANELKGAEIDVLAQIRDIRRGFKPGKRGDTQALARATRDLVAVRKARHEAETQAKASKTKPAPAQSAQQPASNATLTNLLDLASQSRTKPVKGRRESGSVSRPPIDDAEDLAS